MSQSDIIRQNIPHRVEVSEGGKDATQRQADPRGETVPPDVLTTGVLKPVIAHPNLNSPAAAQLQTADAESPNEWPDETQLAERLKQLRATNERLQMALVHLNHPGHRGP